ncbi:MAG: hypothetical protein IM504_24110 [Microcystis sp. M038S2]|jgi:hypothetical protein|uniref:hypothetical protein n=1 Tax=unclassified Microcystis TaxID=2643300 RepID=UPI001D21DA83|nr:MULTISPECIES: hypothetical protein [unclassified Microcystis]MCA2762209.1 hypothetical protein [Microcystis sp. M151S2]NCQ71712.1 hypothetical protein [Microcystis aeruginosa W13-16]NCQ76163.1 hypothetical protein [Microcystis aeruginosa W13-13]NCQ80691.1 hypothetical protein [Microcystis aeruginosa W13-15]NCR15456.1 hypothetical protein [Microcystis aeruginosa SX13-11]NCR19718.1 hypothetical protein [Microcystis aeruginosa LL13-03]NCR20887.1 hypothetical protein [Microcystis aeruginosa L
MQIMFKLSCCSVNAIALALLWGAIGPVWAETELDLDPKIRQESPVLERWLEKIPDIAEDIRNDPSFRTRIRLGYAQFPSSDNSSGVILGVEDVFFGQTSLTLSGDYQTAFNGNRTAIGANLQYYLLPLGDYVNLAPMVGYRYIQTGNYSTDGLNLGLKLKLALSRTGAADITVSQSFISPGGANEVGLTTLSVGYAITSNLRLAADIQAQNSRARKDSSLGILLEWLP